MFGFCCLSLLLACSLLKIQYFYLLFPDVCQASISGTHQVLGTYLLNEWMRNTNQHPKVQKAQPLPGQSVASSLSGVGNAKVEPGWVLWDLETEAQSPSNFVHGWEKIRDLSYHVVTIGTVLCTSKRHYLFSFLDDEIELEESYSLHYIASKLQG